MDFLDPRKKRAHKIRLYIGYALIAFALIIGSSVLFFEARGFDINRKTGEIIQNGLVFVSSHPESARVYVNDKQEAKTNSRLTIPSGDYNFRFEREGYREWKRSFHLGGSEIERLDYVFLFPKKLATSVVRSYKNPPQFVSQSPDRKWLIVQQADNLSSFDIFDLGNQTKPDVTSFTVPVSILDTRLKDSKLELVEWSTDNRHLLVKHSFAGGKEFIMIDRERPSESINLDKLFDVPIYQIALRDKKFDKFHILDKLGGTLSFADSTTKKIQTVAPKVYSFKSYGNDVIFYVSGAGAKMGNVRVDIINGNKTYNIRELKSGTIYTIDITRYDHKWYMAVGSNTEGKSYIYRDVFESFARKPEQKPSPVAVFMIDNLFNIAVSANTRFISSQGNGGRFAIYDAEHNRQYQYDTKLKFTDNQKATWMDGHRLTAVIGGSIKVWDYDGINMQTLVSANNTFLPYYDRDYDFLYTISPINPKDKTVNLSKTPMRTPADL